MNFRTKNNPLSILLNDKDQLPSSISFHENIIRNYLQNTKLENVLLGAFKELFKQDSYLPKNPYFKLVRWLQISNSQKEIIENFEKVINALKKTDLKDPPNKQYEITSIGESGSIWGLPYLLEWVDPFRIERLKFSLFEVIPDFESMIGEFNVHIVHSMGGGHILKSEVLEYPDSASKPLEIAAEVFFSGESLIEAKSAFANYVFDDVISLTNLKDLHLFKSFVFMVWDEENKEMKKKTWTLKEMITAKTRFLNDVENNISNISIKQEIFYLRALVKGKMIDYNKNLEDFTGFKVGTDKKENYFQTTEVDGRFQYFDTFKIYNFHYTDLRNGGAKQSYESQPMSSLLKVPHFLWLPLFSKIKIEGLLHTRVCFDVRLLLLQAYRKFHDFQKLPQFRPEAAEFYLQRLEDSKHVAMVIFLYLKEIERDLKRMGYLLSSHPG